jgi:hypothetical protein
MFLLSYINIPLLIVIHGQTEITHKHKEHSNIQTKAGIKIRYVHTTCRVATAWHSCTRITRTCAIIVRVGSHGYFSIRLELFLRKVQSAHGILAFALSARKAFFVPPARMALVAALIKLPKCN